MSDVPVEVFRSRAKKPCLERALVLKARGIPHELAQWDGAFRLVVAAGDAQAAIDELEDYRRENVDWPPKPDRPPMVSRGTVTAIAYALLMIAFFPVGQHGAFGLNFWEAGRMDATHVLAGEWWRTVTPLTLHSDLRHLTGNLVFGVGFGVLCAHAMGGGITWLAAALAGGLGNYANAWLRGPGHRSIGASTAVFGVLGLLCAYEWARRHALRHSPMRRVGPILGGAVLLGWLGAGGENTDVSAHVTGLVAGVLLGIAVAGSRLPERLSARTQAGFGCAALVLVFVAWWRALV